MSKTILIAGFGPGISQAVATRFGREGYAVALVARTAAKVTAGAEALAKAGVTARGFAADLSSPANVAEVVAAARALGPIAAVHWNAYGGGAGDLTTATPAELAATLGVATGSLLAAVQAALPDLRAQRGAVLVTNGGFGFNDPKIDGYAVATNNMGLSIANAAKRKLVGVLAAKLAPDVFVGEVIVTGSVKGTAWDDGSATIDPAAVAEKFWALQQARAETSVTI